MGGRGTTSDQITKQSKKDAMTDSLSAFSSLLQKRKKPKNQKRYGSRGQVKPGKGGRQDVDLVSIDVHGGSTRSADFRALEKMRKTLR